MVSACRSRFVAAGSSKSSPLILSSTFLQLSSRATSVACTFISLPSYHISTFLILYSAIYLMPAFGFYFFYLLSIVRDSILLWDQP